MGAQSSFNKSIIVIHPLFWQVQHNAGQIILCQTFIKFASLQKISQNFDLYLLPILPQFLDGTSRLMMIIYLRQFSIGQTCMQHLIDSESEHCRYSPSAFLNDLSPPHPLPEFPLELLNPDLLKQERSSVEQATLGSEKNARKKIAGLKSREKKKRHLEILEASVRGLAGEIEACESAISKCKDQLVQALRAATSNTTEHSFTFAELERATRSGEGDMDRLNLLLDLIQNRIGANGTERQAKLDYNFKQIINSLFPAMHRYLMYTAKHQKDLFAKGGEKEDAWITPLFAQLGLSSVQREKIAMRRDELRMKRRETVGLISKLKNAKEQLKNQEQIFERALTCIREDMAPLQSAQLILFGERNKLRAQFSIFCDEFSTFQPLPSE